ncbi:MAG: LamG-like jellyroll fold domain-containing protein, partial [Crocosphaera sp.]
MNTQLILDLLTQSYNDLTNFFVGLGLLDNELAISQLKTNFETAWHNFLAEYKLKKEELNLSNANLEILLNEVILDQNYQLVEEERLQDLLIDKSALEKRIEIFQEQKSSIENFSEAEKQVINSKIIQIKDDILQTEEQLEQHRQQLSNSTSETEINELKLEIKVLQKELIAHILRLETQKDLLGLSDLDLAQKLATVELQISQESDDLERLNTIIIPEQETIVANANDVLLTLESKLNNAETTQLTAENSLTNFEQTNNYLLTDDFTNFLDWNIIDNTPEVVKDWQKVLGLQNLEITEDRLISFQSQAFLEDSVSVALGINNLESFIQLEQQLATEIQTLSDIWWTNLEDSHDWTIKVFNLIQNRTDSVNDLVIYIEDNLAIPEEDYVLDQINLKEAIALQEAQVKYRDSLAQSVDSLEEAISVFETRVEQTEILSEEISFLSTLTNLEQEYVTLGDQASQSLRLQLIDILQQDIEGRNEDLVVQIDLSNKQQEIQIETVLHQYIEDKQNKIIDNQAIQLTLLNETFEQPNNGVYLDGVNDYINVESQDNVRISNALTLEAWIKPQANNKRRMIFGREREYLLSIGTDNKIYFGLYVTNPGWRWISTNYTVDLNQWTHIAFTYTEEQGIKLYADGELVYTYQTTGAIINNTAANPYDLRIGNRQEYGNIDSFKGEMDEV